MDVQQIIEQLGEKLGVGALSLGESNQTTVCLDDVWNVTCEFDGDTQEILLFLPLSQLRLSELREPAVQRALQAMFALGARSAGFALSELEALDCAVLWRRYRVDDIDADELLAQVTRLAEVGAAAMEEAQSACDDVAGVAASPAERELLLGGRNYV